MPLDDGDSEANGDGAQESVFLLGNPMTMNWGEEEAHEREKTR